MKTVAAILFIAYLCVATALVLGLAVDIGNWHPGSTVTADRVIFGILVFFGPFFLGIFIGKNQS